jgi:hypothetical protein
MVAFLILIMTALAALSSIYFLGDGNEVENIAKEVIEEEAKRWDKEKDLEKDKAEFHEQSE